MSSSKLMKTNFNKPKTCFMESLSTATMKETLMTTKIGNLCRLKRLSIRASNSTSPLKIKTKPKDSLRTKVISTTKIP